MNGTGNAEGVRQVWDKYKYALLVVLIGAGLMLLPEALRREEAGASVPTLPESAEVQREMEEILGRMRGVGQVRVMLTEEHGGERILAQDTGLSFRGERTSPAEYSRDTETVLVDGTNGKEALEVCRSAPAYRGALVVCEGGGQPTVKLAVVRAVSALTGLSADRVAVEEWQSSYGGGKER